MRDNAGGAMSNAQPLQQIDRTYSEVVDDLTKASIPVQQLRGREDMSQSRRWPAGYWLCIFGERAKFGLGHIPV